MIKVKYNAKLYLSFSTVLEKKIAYMVIWMNITCLICWTPMMIVTILQVTPAYPTPLFNSVANAILHVSVIFNAVLNLYFRTDLRNAITLLCLRRGDVEDRRDAGSNVNSWTQYNQGTKGSA